MFYSPLRYPGGKNKLAPFIAKICADNNITGHYIEPYAGGASVALFLLLENFVHKITINDKDRSIYAFWYSVLYHTEELCRLIETTDININEWKNQREIQKNKEKVSLLELGFSTLFLNRTNRSGILNGGAIGGTEQKGNYSINCRFNKEDIIKKIKLIACKRDYITIESCDALELIDKVQQNIEVDNTIFYFDPPYYLKANSLYMNHYKEEDHKLVSEKIKAIKNIKWIVSYDNVPKIQELYLGCLKKEYSFKHTAYCTRIGHEVLFFSANIKQPEILDWNPIYFKLKKNSKSQSLFYKKPILRMCLDLE